MTTAPGLTDAAAVSGVAVAPVDLTGRTGLWPRPELRLWRAAMARALAEVDPSMRAPLGGDRMLREQLARHTGAPVDRTVVVAGIRAAAAAVVRPATRVVLERPTFLGVARVLAAAGVEVGTEPWERLADAPAGSAVWFTTPARNPDGRTADAAVFDAVGRLATGGRTVVCNTAYEWFGPAPPDLPGVVRVATLHKLAGPGACLGWVSGDALTPDTVMELSLAAPPLHWQRAWGHFLAVGGLALLRERYAHLPAARCAFLDGVAAPGPLGMGPHVLLPVTCQERAAVDALAAAGVLVSPGSAFAAPGPSIRVSLAGLTVPQVRTAAATVAAVLGTHLSTGLRQPAPAASGAGATPG